MTVRCLFITSSYSRRCFLMSKLWASTFFWAFSIALDMRLCSMGWPSSIPSRSMMDDILSSPGHIGGNGYGVPLTGPGNDLRFLLVVFGIQHRVRDIGSLQHLA